MSLKQAARGVLHHMGGLAALRLVRRGKFRVLMFHEFHEQHRTAMERICEHISSNFEPVSLTRVSQALRGEVSLPANALAVTIDDGYFNVLEHGHPVLRKYRIPATVYAVAGFSNGELWLWTDQVAFVVQHTVRKTIRLETETGVKDFDVGSAVTRGATVEQLWADLKEVSNELRIAMVESLALACGVEIPPSPPADRRALNWDELRGLAADGFEIGCHTYSHPILSRIGTRKDLDRETRGARELMEDKLGFPVHHFCYPNGRDIDIGEAAPASVQAAGFISSVTCTWGLNTTAVDPFRIQRVPFDESIDFRYGAELLAGLHL